MSEQVTEAVELLDRAVTSVLEERPVELPGSLALARCSALLVARERLDAAALAAIGDVDRRELYALDATGSTRTWLRNQVCGDAGQLAQARRLHEHEQVFLAQAMGELSARGASQVCAALDKLPDEVPADRLEAVLVDGLQDLLGRQLGRGLPEHLEPTPAQLALRAELASVVGDALADDFSSPAARLEPALLLLARETAPGLLAWALGYLLSALVPDAVDERDRDGYYVDLVPVLDGDWDLRGHLDHETGTLLHAELARQERARHQAAAQAGRERAAESSSDLAGPTSVATSAAAGQDSTGSTGATAPADGRGAVDADAFDVPPTPADGGGAPLRTKSQQRHDDLTQLLRDAADRDAGTGQPAPVAITVVGTVDAVEGRAGALPGTLLTKGRPSPLSTEALQRMGCHSELTAVLVDAAGRPVGASTTRRSADRRQRAALAAIWGAFCAVAGCTRTVTVPHHVEPWWLSRQTVLRDLIPLCDHDHHDLHEGHRTLRLQDGRRIDELGWVADAA